MFEKRIRASGAVALPTLLLAVLTACAAPEKNKPATSDASADLKPEKILATMERVADWQIAQAARYRTTDWTQGALYAGMMALDRVSPSSRFRDAAYRAGAINQWKLGPSHYNADDHCVGQMYAEMAMRLDDPRTIAPMRAQF